MSRGWDSQAQDAVQDPEHTQDVVIALWATEEVDHANQSLQHTDDVGKSMLDLYPYIFIFYNVNFK